jgi:hypothetical protein
MGFSIGAKSPMRSLKLNLYSEVLCGNDPEIEEIFF